MQLNLIQGAPPHAVRSHAGWCTVESQLVKVHLQIWTLVVFGADKRLLIIPLSPQTEAVFLLITVAIATL